MSSDVLARIDETLTFYSAGLGEDVTVPVEGPDGMYALEEALEAWQVRVLPRLALVFEQLVPVAQAAVDFVRQMTRLFGPLFCEPRRLVRRRRRRRRAELRRVHVVYVRRPR